MKKVGKTTGPFRYDINQIPYDYTVEVTNRLKGLDLTVPEELWMEVCDIVQEAVIKVISDRETGRKARGAPSGGNGLRLSDFLNFSHKQQKETTTSVRPFSILYTKLKGLF